MKTMHTPGRMMRTGTTGLIRRAAAGMLLGLALSGSAVAWLPGTYPSPPARMHSRGFSVDTTNRNDVLAFWHAVYSASEGYENRIKWTGNYKGSNGTVSADFTKDVERRLNFFRALCGLPADVRVNSGSTVVVESGDPHKPADATTKASASQAAALMLILNYDSGTGRNPALDHSPPKNLKGWSTAAWNANFRGNLAFGVFGPGAITEYMMEELSTTKTTSTWNTQVGHRRWCIHPEATDFATGDQPGESAYLPPTNVLYVGQNEPGELRSPAGLPQFVAYPAPGFFPAPLNSRFWSLSAKDADFSNASVRVIDSGGRAVSLVSIRRDATYGDPALIWEMPASASTKRVYGDQSYRVSVSGIAGPGLPSSHSYVVTLINPDRLTSNQALGGPATASAGKTTDFTFTAPPGAEALRVSAFRRMPAKWIEGAEKSISAQVIDLTSPAYPLRLDMAKKGVFGTLSGKYAFNLTFPDSYDVITRSVPEQSFELKRLILPGSKAKLEFIYRRGYMTPGSTMVTEISSDGGVAWRTVGKPVRGVSLSRYDTKSSQASIALPKSSQPLLLRFRYYAAPNSAIYTHKAAPTQPTGIFIDDIQVKNCDWLEPKKSTGLPGSATGFAFNTTSSGAPLAKGEKWNLALSTRLGGRWFPHGPMKQVVITTP